MGNLKHGWVKLDRSIQSHWLWEKKPFDKARAWIDLILMVNYEEKKVYIDNKLFIIHPGEAITSITKLSSRWGWDRRTVKRFLDVLKMDGMLNISCAGRCTLISLVNYEKFQGDGTQKGTVDGTPKRTPKAQVNVQNNAQESPSSMYTMEERYKKDKRIEENKKGATDVPSEQEDEDDEGWMDPADIVIPKEFYNNDV